MGTANKSANRRWRKTCKSGDSRGEALVQDLSQRLVNASGTIELATIVEEAQRELSQRDQQNPAIRQRLNSIITTANQRLRADQSSTAITQFNSLEQEITTLLAQNDYEAARNRMASYIVENNANLTQRKELLAERIEMEQKRYLELLSRQIDRLEVSKDVEGLKKLRAELPAFLLEHPLTVYKPGNAKYRIHLSSRFAK